MMAARAGAKHVYACEVSELMVHQARKSFAANNLNEKISVFHKVSNHLKVGEDLPEKVDIIVAEIFDTGLLGEQALRTFAHARAHLLKPGGKILPLRASIQAVLIESDLLQKEVVTTECCGFQVENMNALTPSYFQARLNSFPHRVLSQQNTVSCFDFIQPGEEETSKEVKIRCSPERFVSRRCFLVYPRFWLWQYHEHRP